LLVRLSVHDSLNSSGSNATSIGKTFRLQIQDTGRGMSLEYMERKLYHPFAQEDAFSPGVGLGLSIVYGDSPYP
jgi:signal transduction histidine kinase